MNIGGMVDMIPDDASRSRVLLLIGRFDAEVARLRATHTSDDLEKAVLGAMADGLLAYSFQLKARLWEYDAGVRPNKSI